MNLRYLTEIWPKQAMHWDSSHCTADISDMYKQSCHAMGTAPMGCARPAADDSLARTTAGADLSLPARRAGCMGRHWSRLRLTHALGISSAITVAIHHCTAWLLRLARVACSWVGGSAWVL